MCARILGERKAGHKRAWMERHTTNFIQRIIAFYGRALDWYLDRAWLTVPIVLACILGLWFFFTHLPFTLLPPGDSGFIRGVFISKEGSSPAQMRAYQAEVNKKIQEDPAVGQFFTLAGFSSRTPLSQGLLFLFLKPRSERPPVDQIIFDCKIAWFHSRHRRAVLTPSPYFKLRWCYEPTWAHAYTISGIVRGWRRGRPADGWLQQL
jgi:HAE1 family hydrophobic/amphiphilic exporter-1